MVDHTSDVDVFLWTHEFDKKIKNRFLADKILLLVMQHGLVNDSYELRLWGWNCKCNVDIMLVTKHNNTDQWNGYHVSQRKYRFMFFFVGLVEIIILFDMLFYLHRQILPAIKEFCSGEVLGRKFTVPCNAIEHLNRMYGSNYEWLKPLDKRYPLYSIDHNGMKWTNDEIPYVVRVYNAYGVISKNSTLSKINSHFEKKDLYIEEIPIDNKFDND